METGMMPKALATLLAAAFAPATLAQLSLLEPKAPPPLPDPPALAHYLLESPLLVISVLLIAAVVTYMALSSKKPARARQAGAGLIALALCVWAVAFFVETPREQAISLTKQLVTDVASGNTKGVDAALASKATLYTDARPDGQSKDFILSKVDTFFGPKGLYPIQDHALLEAQAYIATPSLAQVQMKVRVTPKDGIPTLSWWQLDMAPKPGGGWEVTGIKYLSANFDLRQLN
jgi:hypothetical protein